MSSHQKGFSCSTLFKIVPIPPISSHSFIFFSSWCLSLFEFIFYLLAYWKFPPVVYKFYENRDFVLLTIAFLVTRTVYCPQCLLNEWVNEWSHYIDDGHKDTNTHILAFFSVHFLFDSLTWSNLHWVNILRRMFLWGSFSIPFSRFYLECNLTFRMISAITICMKAHKNMSRISEPVLSRPFAFHRSAMAMSVT